MNEAFSDHISRAEEDLAVFRRITSRQNDAVKRVVQLMSGARARRKHSLFPVEGVRLCRDALASGAAIAEVYCAESCLEKIDATLLHRLAASSGACYRVPDELFHQMSGEAAPQGILCVCRMEDDGSPSSPVWQDGVYVALETVSNPRNLGAIARTAEALGVAGIVISGDACDIYNPASMQASMGAFFRIPVFRAEDMPTTIRNAHENGVVCYGAVVDSSARPVNGCQHKQRVMIVIGNEGNGLTEAARRACDVLVTIPMRGRAESLNAAAAAAILLWEMVR